MPNKNKKFENNATDILNEIAKFKLEISKDIYQDAEMIGLYNRLSKIERSLYRCSQFVNTGLNEKAVLEVEEVELTLEEIIQFSKYTLNTQKYPISKLKRRRKKTIYIWKTEPEACNDCEALNGMEYECKEDIPPKLHPNCKCSIEEVERIEDLDPPADSEGKDAPQEPSGDGDGEGDEEDSQKPKRKIWEKLIKLITMVERFVSIIKNMVKNAEKITLPFQYWKIFLNNTPENKNLDFLKLYQIRDIELKDFIKKKYKVSNFTPVFVAKPNDEIYKNIEKLPEIISFSKKYYNDIKNGKYVNTSISYKFLSFDYANTIGKCEMYHPYIDKEGNLNFVIVDLYDFELIKNYGNDIMSKGVTILNNLSYLLQIHGNRGNYVIIIPIKINADKIRIND